MMQQINLLRRAARKPAFSWTSPRAIGWTIGLAISISVIVAAYEHYELYALTRQAARMAGSGKVVANVPMKGKRTPGVTVIGSSSTAPAPRW